MWRRSRKLILFCRLKEYAGLKQTQVMKSLDLNSTSPASLAERFRGELYDQHWKQAYQTLTGRMKKDEKKAAQILVEICTVKTRTSNAVISVFFVDKTFRRFPKKEKKRNDINNCCI